MSYLTIDVGLKNLALCLMNNEEILLWDVYNLISEDHKECSSFNKNGNKCKAKALVYTKESDIFTYTCKKHSDKTIKNYTVKEKKVKDYLLQDIALIVLKKCDSIYSENIHLFANVKGVYIELQPKINPKMKLISHLIFGKFTELLSETPGCKIRFVPASRKLKAYKGPIIDASHIKSKYKKRKYLSVEYTKIILKEKIKNSDKWLSFLKEHVKQDDLCDSFCMAINCCKL